MNNHDIKTGFYAHGILNLSPKESFEICKGGAIIVDVRESYINNRLSGSCMCQLKTRERPRAQGKGHGARVKRRRARGTGQGARGTGHEYNFLINIDL